MPLEFEGCCVAEQPVNIDLCGAVLDDGSVATSDDLNRAGDRSSVQQQLRKAQHNQASGVCVFCIASHRSVVTWDDAGHSRYSSAAQSRL